MICAPSVCSYDDGSYWPLPDPLLATPTPVAKAAAPLYRMEVPAAGNPFGLTVTRIHDGTTLWRTGTLVMASQYLEIRSKLPMSEPYVFGLGERDAALRMRFDTPYVMFSQDVAPINSTLNQYGAHPFYLHVDPETQTAVGVLLWNSHAMDVTLSKRCVIL